MNVMMVTAKVSADRAEEVAAEAKVMFAGIEQAGPSGVRYASCVLADGVTFVALLALDDPDVNPLVQVPEFGQFQARLKEWLDGPPSAQPMTVVGSYNLF